MAGKSAYHRAIVVIDIIYLLFIVISIIHSSRQCSLPESILTLDPLNSLHSINSVVVSGADDVEFLLTSSRIGDSVTLAVNTPLGDREIRTSLVAQNSWAHIISVSFVGILFVALGIIVFLLKPEDAAARLFHLTSLSTAAAMIGTRDIIGLQPPLAGEFSCALFFVAYSFLPACFLHFTMVFPRPTALHSRKIHRLFYTAAALLSLWQTIAFVRAADARSLGLFHQAQTSLSVFDAFLFAGLVAGLVNLGLSYKKADSIEEQKKLRWIIYGLIVGTAPFIFLWVLPKVLFSHHWISEEIFQLFLLLIPVTFAISILRYRLMDIDFIIERGTVYTIVVGLLVGSYALFVGVLAAIIPAWGGAAPVAAAILVALLFEPVRARTQQFVDKRFFHVLYDIRETLPRFAGDLKRTANITELAELLVARTDQLLLPERIGFFSMQESSHRLNLIAHKDFGMLERHSIPFEVMKLKTRLQLPVALDGSIEPGIAFESADGPTFRRWGMAIAFPMLTEKLEIVGFLVLGPKKSGVRFTLEDVNLLNVVTTQAGLELERITLQMKIIVEQEENRHLAELNQMKSYFVSSVSHDLKTPLASIRMHAELLRMKTNGASKKRGESLDIIEGESERLARLIDNVLDAAKMEIGAKKYNFAEVELNTLVRHVLRLLHYEFKMRKFKVHATISKKKLAIHGDADAIDRALINLIANAMKYAGEKKWIAVSTSYQDGFAAVRVEDKGIGISRDDQENIFDQYYRSKDRKTQFQPGLGLGLSIVKHIVDAHGGNVEVRSGPGEGSTFTLLFPMRTTQ